MIACTPGDHGFSVHLPLYVMATSDTVGFAIHISPSKPGCSPVLCGTNYLITWSQGRHSQDPCPLLNWEAVVDLKGKAHVVRMWRVIERLSIDLVSWFWIPYMTLIYAAHQLFWMMILLMQSGPVSHIPPVIGSQTKAEFPLQYSQPPDHDCTIKTWTEATMLEQFF